eukprot:Em0012g161a
MEEEREVTDGDAKSSVKRRRLKGLLQRIQQQVEFYLGDANLPKDKFLQEKVKQHPEGYVALELIASFNKMKSITTDLGLVVQAVEHSSVLQLSEDKKWVKRVSPLPTSSDVDMRTIYIENLPKQASHDFVRNLLKRFGTISYISLPRHKTSSFIKGFAFVEFSTAQEAQDVVMFFKTHQGHGSAQSIPPHPLDGGGRMEITAAKVQSREQHVSEVVARDAVGEEVVARDVGEEVIARDIGEEEAVTKEEGKVSFTSVDRGTTITSEVTGHGDACIMSEGTVPVTSNQGNVPITSEVTNEGNIPITSDVTSKGDVPITSEVTTKTGSRQLIVGDGPSGHRDGSMGATTDQIVFPIKEHQDGKEVIAVVKEEASSHVAGVKRSHCSDDEGAGAKRKRAESEGEESRAAELPSCGETEEGEGEKEKRKRGRKKKKKQPGLEELDVRVMSKVEWLEMKRLYAQLQKEQLRKLKAAVSMAPTSGREKPKGFVPHTLVKVVCEGTSTAKTLKELSSQYGKVAYVDFSDGDKEGYVRFASQGCVEKLLTCQPPEGVTLQAVDVEGERAYYMKTQAARKQQRLHNVKKKHIRGKEKVISKALQNQVAKSNPPVSQSIHIRFSDDEESGGAQ